MYIYIFVRSCCFVLFCVYKLTHTNVYIHTHKYTRLKRGQIGGKGVAKGAHWWLLVVSVVIEVVVIVVVVGTQCESSCGH